jgi:hypothetical protein
MFYVLCLQSKFLSKKPVSSSSQFPSSIMLLLLSLLLSLCLVQFVAAELVYVDLVPADSPALKPSFAPLNFWQLSFTATGYGYSDFSAGLIAPYIPPANEQFFASIIVDAESQNGIINITSSVYYYTATAAYVYIPAENACAVRTGWTYTDQIQGYSQTIQSGKALSLLGPVYIATGPTFDGTSCQDVIFSTFFLTSGGYPTFWGFQQAVNLYGTAGNFDVANGGIHFDRINNARPNAEVFALPAACATPVLEICGATSFLGITPTFPSYAPFPGPQYTVP